ncbi:hypothetical protein I6F65_20190 [Pseudoalteromonas sp. SWXJZ94C]|uniref:DUF6795 domain-containing protein n=1 Tax=unclassified Pseudoalteromonas TaxID=194690 RepID=UPI00140B2F0F|nr:MULTISPECIES: DUF6795 domain-containing protein [unclassified Pseudoalteromonas]MBH0059265.1 hypothetical protein [Pseudoalteromonas sp. SWXJZ94C]
MLSLSLKKLLLVIASITVIFTTPQAFANMFGFFDKQEFVLSAPVKGQLLNEGQPVADTKVIRSLTYGDEYLDETITDSNGNFSFAEKIIKTSKPSNMFDNGSLIQHIYLENGTPEGVVLWAVRVTLHEQSNTLKRLLANLVCEISKEPQTFDIPIEEDTSHTYAIYTSCKL